MSFFNYKTVITRKDHKCTGCLDIIPAGEKAEKFSGIYDGDFNHGYLCLVCNEVLKDLGEVELSEGEIRYCYTKEWEEKKRELENKIKKLQKS